MLQICVFDPSVSSDNLGDQIIARAIYAQLDALMPMAFRIAVPTHDYTWRASREATKHSRIRFVAGSNLLKSWMFWNAQWKLTPLDPFLLKDVVLFGCGWRNYQPRPEFFTRSMLRALLSKHFTHSVRDSYTLEQLRSAGISNVVNTGCPTMWGLTPQLCAQIPASKSDAVVFTITEYAKDPERDRRMINIIRKNYEKVFFFGQQPEDFSYLKALDAGSVQVLPPSIQAYDALLSDLPVDYIGTRLHGGIFSLAHVRRTLIIGIDNRAEEIATDTGLPVLSRIQVDALEDWITGAQPTSIRMPTAAIDTWKEQFNAIIERADEGWRTQWFEGKPG